MAAMPSRAAPLVSLNRRKAGQLVLTSATPRRRDFGRRPTTLCAQTLASRHCARSTLCPTNLPAEESAPLGAPASSKIPRPAADGRQCSGSDNPIHKRRSDPLPCECLTDPHDRQATWILRQKIGAMPLLTLAQCDKQRSLLIRLSFLILFMEFSRVPTSNLLNAFISETP
jgi:hypothetical protein